jgi:hypothetical protein
MERLLSPLQSDATSGVGKTLIVPDPERIVRFSIRSKGTPMGGGITFECCPTDTGQAPRVSAGMVWRAMKTLPVPTIFLRWLNTVPGQRPACSGRAFQLLSLAAAQPPYGPLLAC